MISRLASQHTVIRLHQWHMEVTLHLPKTASCEARVYLVVIVSQGSAQLIVIHVRFVFPEPPQLGHFLRLEELELAIVGGPADQMLMLLVQQQLQQELPQRDCTLHTWGGREQSAHELRRPV